MSIMKKAAALLSMVALIGSTMALPAFADGGQEVKTLAHWKFQDVAGYYTGSVDDDNITFVDLTGNGNDLVPATAGNGDQLDIFMWDDGCDIPTAKGNTALKMDNTKAKAATVDPYTAEETSYTGGYTSGKYLQTVESAPLNNMQFEHGFAFEIVYKLSPELDNNYNRYTGLFSRQGVVEGANEPPFSIALAEWNNEESTGTLGANGTWMQYVHVDPDGMKTNNEYDSAMMYAGDWHHILVTSDGELTEIYVDGEDIDLVGESSLINITDPSYRWEVGVGRKNGEGHESDSKNVNSPEGMIRRLFAGTISEIRVCDGYMSLEDSLWFKAASYDSIPTPVETAEAPAEEAPAEEPAVEEPAEAPAEEAPAEEPAVEEPAEAPAEEPAAESKGFADVNAAADGKGIITAYTFTEGTNGFGGEGAENLFDGDTATKFCTNEFPAEAVAELDGIYKVTGFTMATANDNADWNGRSPNAWTISVSADGENWTELASGDDTFFEETNFTYYVGDASAEGVSYVKFNAAGTASGTFQVSELTLFGEKTAEAVETPEAVDEAMDDKAEAPQTFDFGVVAAVTAVISLAGFAASKKRH